MNDDTDTRDEEVLRRVLREEADTVHPRPNWDDVRRRAHGRRRRRWVPAAAAVITLLALTAGLVAVVSDDDQTGVVADGAGPPAPSEQSTTGHTPTTTADASTTSLASRMEAGPDVGPLELPSGEPLGDDEMVASIVIPTQEVPAVEIVVLSKSSGEVVRTLADGYDTVEGGVYGFTLTPDRRTALYVVATSACTSRIEAVAVDGSADPVPVVDDGNHVAVSPDGSTVAVETGDVCVGPASVDLLPIEGGRSTRYPSLGSEDGVMESLAFFDAGTLLFSTTVRETDEPARLSSLHLPTGHITSRQPPGDPLQYTALDRRNGVVMALESSESGDPSAVILGDGDVVDRRPVDVDDPRSVQAIGVDQTGADIGAVVIAEGFETLTIDGRLVRDDVLDVAF